MDALTQLVVWLSAAANALGRICFAPIAVMPEWLSLVLVSVLTGVLLLVVFKYTSHQRAIKAIRNDVKAHLLALKLFQDSLAVTFRAQGRIFLGSFWLLLLAIVPMLVMMVPVGLLLAQLALWYQTRPLKVGEEAVITLKLGGDAQAKWPDVRLEPTEALETTIGPLRVQSKREVCWNVKMRQDGYHRLAFLVGGQRIDKELAVGKSEAVMRISAQRPGWDWVEVLQHPAEVPFGPESVVQSIEIDYPERSTWKIAGVEPWLVYWFVLSMVAGLCFRPMLNVSI